VICFDAGSQGPAQRAAEVLVAPALLHDVAVDSLGDPKYFSLPSLVTMLMAPEFTAAVLGVESAGLDHDFRDRVVVDGGRRDAGERVLCENPST